MEATIKVQNNKLVLNKEATQLLGVKANDRIAVNYWSQNAEETFPVIGRASLFACDGNRLTKSNTVSYRGAQRDILLQYGNYFKLEPFKHYFKMVKIEEPEITSEETFEEEEEYLNNLI